jgi:hypothetical protein
MYKAGYVSKGGEYLHGLMEPFVRGIAVPLMAAICLIPLPLLKICPNHFLKPFMK